MAHWLDTLYAKVMSRRPMFQGGWGDPEVLARVEGGGASMAGVDRPVDIEWVRAHTVGSVTVRDGTFVSPRPDVELPPAAALAHVRWFSAEHPRLLVVLAGSSEQGYGLREQVWRPLLRQGIDVLLLENPYYGARRPQNQRGATLHTVVDQVKMSAATVAESSGLLWWARGRGYQKLCIAGYSMGGYMACVTAAVTPFDVGIVAMAAGASARHTFTETLFAQSIAFKALGEDRARLAAVIDKGSVRHLPTPPRTDAAVLVGCQLDGFVPKADVEALAAAWPKASLRWVPAGHISALVWQRAALRQAAVDAFARL